METLQNTLKILNDLANEHVCDWSGNDDKETVGRMVERVIVLTNAMGEKLDTLEEFIREIYKIQFSHKAVEVAHV